MDSAIHRTTSPRLTTRGAHTTQQASSQIKCVCGRSTLPLLRREAAYGSQPHKHKLQRLRKLFSRHLSLTEVSGRLGGVLGTRTPFLSTIAARQLQAGSLRKLRLDSGLVARGRLSVDNRELLTGDCLLLVSFCLYKQITAIILHPTFPGWLAPLKFNPVRFEELASFSTTLVASWVISSLLVGGYQSNATADLPTALARVSLAWLVSMPVAACQLVLLTAAEDGTLIGDDLFASALPLAATGPGEPLATAAGVLGLMALWRCFYTAFLDFFNSRQWSGSGASVDRYQDMRFFTDTLRTVFLLSIACIVLIQFLGRSVGEEGLARMMDGVMRTLPGW